MDHMSHDWTFELALTFLGYWNLNNKLIFIFWNVCWSKSSLIEKNIKFVTNQSCDTCTCLSKCWHYRGEWLRSGTPEHTRDSFIWILEVQSWLRLDIFERVWWRLQTSKQRFWNVEIVEPGLDSHLRLKFPVLNVMFVCLFRLRRVTVAQNLHIQSLKENELLSCNRKT